jgi:hypothetical protein
MSGSNFRKLLLVVTIGSVIGVVLINRKPTSGPAPVNTGSVATEKSKTSETSTSETPKVEPKAETETKTETKTEPKTEPKTETKAEPKTETKVEPKVEEKTTPKAPVDPLEKYTDKAYMAKTVYDQGSLYVQVEFKKAGGNIAEKRFQTPLLEILANSSNGDALFVLQYIGRFGSDAKSMVPELIEILKKKTEVTDSQFRQAASRTFCAMGTDGRPAVPAMIEAMGREGASSRRTIANQMCRMLTGSDQLYSKLEMLEQSEDENDRLAAKAIFEVFDRERLKLSESGGRHTRGKSK